MKNSLLAFNSEESMDEKVNWIREKIDQHKDDLFKLAPTGFAMKGEKFNNSHLILQSAVDSVLDKHSGSLAKATIVLGYLDEDSVVGFIKPFVIKAATQDGLWYLDNVKEC